jgi:hypothetical protein
VALIISILSTISSSYIILTMASSTIHSGFYIILTMASSTTHSGSYITLTLASSTHGGSYIISTMAFTTHGGFIDDERAVVELLDACAVDGDRPARLGPVDEEVVAVHHGAVQQHPLRQRHGRRLAARGQPHARGD